MKAVDGRDAAGMNVKKLEEIMKATPSRVDDAVSTPATMADAIEVPIKRLLTGARPEDVVNPGTLQNPEALFGLLEAARQAAS